MYLLVEEDGVGLSCYALHDNWGQTAPQGGEGNLDVMGQQTVFPDAYAVAAHIAPLRAAGKRLVTTNGCFDLIHTGHVQYLSEAAALGDILVVGVNADITVRRLKGPGRPLQSEAERVRIVGSLRMVDAAFVFYEDDPRAFLEVLRPSVHVKGGDYSVEIVERSVVERYGGVVKIVSLVPGKSTTKIVERIRAQKPAI